MFAMKKRTPRSFCLYTDGAYTPDEPLDRVSGARSSERNIVALSRFGLPDVLGVAHSRYLRKHSFLQEHRHPNEIELHFCISGSLRFSIRDEQMDLLPGQICLTQPDVPHHLLTNNKGHEHYWLLVDVKSRPNAFLSLPSKESAALVADLRAIDRNMFKANADLLPLFKKLFALLASPPRPPRATMRIRALVLDILLAVIDSAAQPAAQPVNRRLQQIISGILAQPADPIDCSDLAARCGMCESRFITSFKELTGFPPLAFRTRCRIEEAQRLMARTSLPIAAIADRLGFTSQSHFGARFHQIVGLTPARWRSSVMK